MIYTSYCYTINFSRYNHFCNRLITVGYYPSSFVKIDIAALYGIGNIRVASVCQCAHWHQTHDHEQHEQQT